MCIENVFVLLSVYRSSPESNARRTERGAGLPVGRMFSQHQLRGHIRTQVPRPEGESERHPQSDQRTQQQSRTTGNLCLSKILVIKEDW